ncbi:MAG: hypothetical protein GY866_25235 [Proteobacteria bacterium]|nr:hypothetical protein [Pseudomonadota bacterium]
MKQTVKKRKKISTAKKSTQFSIDLDARGLIFFLVLVGLTAATVFYLGIIFGKATRNPNDPSLRPKSGVDLQPAGETSESPKNLNIFNIRDRGKSVETLKKDSEQLFEKTDKMIKESERSARQAEAKKRMEARTAVEKPVKTAPRKAAKPKTFTPQWPDVGKSQDGGTKLYTIQVAATKSKEKASRIVSQLRKKAFDAYMVDVMIQGAKIYRIRVGRQPKAKIRKMKVKLDRVVGGMGMKPKIIPLN